MGLLDDAIREHLELKRRRGADLEELSRQEAEALGPARRGEASAAPAVADPPPAVREEPPADHDDVPPAAPPEPTPAALDEPATAYAPPPVEPAPAPEPEPPLHRDPEPEPYRAPEPEPEPELRDEPPPLPPPPPAPPAPRRAPDPEPRPLVDDAQSTREFSADEVADAASEPDPDVVPADDGEHDELEETPDFLQETPEHDRLWFEQKPPKDFDF